MTESSSQLVKSTFAFDKSPNLVFNLPVTHPNKVSVLGISKNMETIRVPISNAFSLPRIPSAPAIGCRVVLEFFNLEGQSLFTSFKGSWTGLDSQRLTSVQQYYEGSWYEGYVKQVDMEKAVGPHDIFPGEEAYIDIACRMEGEESGFVWMERSYFHVLAGKSPFSLEPGACLVRLSVFGKNVCDYTMFKILITEEDFKGVPVTTEEMALLTYDYL
jgi:hypothetical protein